MSNEGPALVTGAARRIGRAMAERLASTGRPVVLHASPRSLAEAESVAASLRAGGARAAALAADLGAVADCEALLGHAATLFGPPTLLVNNASLFEVDSAAEFSAAQFDRHMAINLRAPLLLARDMAALLPDGAEGVIVNIVDQRVWRLTPRQFTYTLSKSALWTATRTMAQSYAPRIRVNAVGPGPVLPSTTLGDADFDRESRGVPLGRAADVDSVVEAALYLIAARHVTGQMIAVDAGQHLAWETPDVV